MNSLRTSYLKIFRNQLVHIKLLQSKQSIVLVSTNWFSTLKPQINATLQIQSKFTYLKKNYTSEEKNDKTESPLKQLLEDAASFEDIIPSSPLQQWATLPYTIDTKTRKQGDFYRKPKKDPRDASIILFPGQGTQYVGMAKKLMIFPIARDLFELANYLLGYDLLKLCLEGPKSKLDETKYCQPAIMVTSLAAIEKLKEERPNAINNCVATAGFSIGEITALVFAGALEFERGIKDFFYVLI